MRLTSEKEQVYRSSHRGGWGGHLLAALGFTGYNAFVRKDAPQSPTVVSTTLTDPAANGDTTSTAAAPTTTPGQPADVANALSWGDRVLFTDTSNADMQAGAVAYASGDYATAAARFEAARQAVRNDPEALIYLNNAKLGSTPAVGVAAVVPIGDSPNTARELLRGVAQAQDEAIKAGTPVKVLIANDHNNAGQAAAIANALVQDPNVIGVIGHGTSTTTLAAAPVYQQGQLPMISPTSTTTELTTVAREGGNFVFRVIPATSSRALPWPATCSPWARASPSSITTPKAPTASRCKTRSPPPWV